ncbi:sugar ABC transporter substrate-binding protein [Desulforamulus profundi]|uniref:Sugar ABC transporter substrate-binding protein n=1 Tax=Desulforamulus profundi TaxID=1383067 RepID=A0A2C6MEI3_9FIRM|nr:substrate-binding domain-containing protein [Desulforamulus profundi]PHJ39729.1 sugar ABC transporter substrate-binding protein [Desulforamulus profundi]
MAQRIRIVLLFTLFLFTLIFITGCPGPESQQKPETGNRVKIGVSLASMEFDGNQSIKKFMQERSKKDKVQIIWTDAKMDPAQQEKDVDKLIKQKVKTIVLQTVDPQEGAKLVDKIIQAKIKVVGLETLPFNAPLDGYVASDHVRTGELEGRFVLNQMNGQAGGQQQGGQGQGGGQQQGGQGQGGQGGGQQNQQQSLAAKNNVKVLILKGDPYDPVSELIASAAQSVLKQSKNIEEIKIIEHPKGDPEMAQMTVQNALKNGTVDAILATDGRMANAAVSVLRSEGLENRVVTVGVGADQKNSQSLAAGQHDAEIDIMPEMLANFTLEAALDLANKGVWNNDTRVQNGNFDIPAKIVPVRLIDISQVHLLKARWGNLQQQQQQQQQQGQQGNQQQGSSSGGQSGGGSGQGGQGQGQQGQKTRLRIVTQDGKVMEVEVDGEIQKIEQADGGQQSGQQGGQQGQQGGGGGQGGQ